MVNIISLYNGISIFTIILALLLQSNISFAEISGTEILNLLKEKDRESCVAGYKVSFVITQDNQFRDPNQGLVFKYCEATWTERGSFAMKITYHYEHPPVFGPLGLHHYQPIDYDKEGNLIVWRSLEKYILFASDRNETIEKIQSFYVDTNGRLVDKGSSKTLLDRFPIGSRTHMYEFNQFKLATGQGFSGYIAAIKSVNSLPSSLTGVTSQGSFGPSISQGTWELTLDPNSDFLVREATFTPDGADKSTVQIKSSGIVKKDELTIAKYGTFKYSDLLEINVEVADISKVDGANTLYEEILSCMNGPLPARSKIIDWRGEKPAVE